MPINKIKFIIFSFLFFQIGEAVEVPRDLRGGQVGFVSRTLGAGCRAFDVPSDVLPCNPAHLAKNRERTFSADLTFGNDISYSDEARKLIRGEADKATVSKLFSERKTADLQSQIEFGYVASNFGFSITPLGVNYRSLFRNSSLPEVSVFASQDQAARMQLASYMGSSLSWGLQLRYLQREVISRRFFLTDALAEDGEKLFQPERQTMFFVEPSIMYASDDSVHRPEVSLGLINSDVIQKTAAVAEGIKPIPELHLSGSIDPFELSMGRWSLGFDSAWDREEKIGFAGLTLASTYQLGILTLLGSVGEKANGLGFSVLSGPLRVGLTSSSRTDEDASGFKSTQQRYDFMLGIQI
jgi:hypothetical protein